MTTLTTTKALTWRERQIAEMLGHGKTTEEIADDLGLSAHTIRTHVKNAMRKLEVNTRAGLVGRLLEQAVEQVRKIEDQAISIYDAYTEMPFRFEGESDMWLLYEGVRSEPTSAPAFLEVFEIAARRAEASQ